LESGLGSGFRRLINEPEITASRRNVMELNRIPKSPSPGFLALIYGPAVA
jgi:hypothetical protein